jgi:hypothetical protein
VGVFSAGGVAGVVKTERVLLIRVFWIQTISNAVIVIELRGSIPLPLKYPILNQ